MVEYHTNIKPSGLITNKIFTVYNRFFNNFYFKSKTM